MKKPFKQLLRAGLQAFQKPLINDIGKCVLKALNMLLNVLQALETIFVNAFSIICKAFPMPFKPLP